MDMPLSVCYCLCKCPLTFTILIFLRRESSLPPSMGPFPTWALGANCPPPLWPSRNLTSWVILFFFLLCTLPFIFSICASKANTPFILYIPLFLPKGLLYHQFLNICKPNQSKSEGKKKETPPPPAPKAAAALFLSSLQPVFSKFLIILAGLICFLCIQFSTAPNLWMHWSALV